MTQRVTRFTIGSNNVSHRYGHSRYNRAAEMRGSDLEYYNERPGMGS